MSTKKKYKFHKRYVTEEPSKNAIREFRAMRESVLNLNIMQMNTNIIDNEIPCIIIEILVYFLHIYIDLTEICNRVETIFNQMSKPYWHCFANCNDFGFASKCVNWYNLPWFVLRLLIIH